MAVFVSKNSQNSRICLKKQSKWPYCPCTCLIGHIARVHALIGHTARVHALIGHTGPCTGLYWPTSLCTGLYWLCRYPYPYPYPIPVPIPPYPYTPTPIPGTTTWPYLHTRAGHATASRSHGSPDLFTRLLLDLRREAIRTFLWPYSES